MGTSIWLGWQLVPSRMWWSATVNSGSDDLPPQYATKFFELGDKSWKETASDGHRGPSRYNP